MVSTETILDTAEEVGADFIGLSGLTDSSQEMSHVVEMKSRGMNMPCSLVELRPDSIRQLEYQLSTKSSYSCQRCI